MFSEDSNWLEDKGTDSLNKSLFGQVLIDPSVKKIQKAKKKKKGPSTLHVFDSSQHGDSNVVNNETKSKKSRKRKLVDDSVGDEHVSTVSDTTSKDSKTIPKQVPEGGKKKKKKEEKGEKFKSDKVVTSGVGDTNVLSSTNGKKTNLSQTKKMKEKTRMSPKSETLSIEIQMSECSEQQAVVEKPKQKKKKTKKRPTKENRVTFEADGDDDEISASNDRKCTDAKTTAKHKDAKARKGKGVPFAREKLTMALQAQKKGQGNVIKQRDDEKETSPSVEDEKVETPRRLSKKDFKLLSTRDKMKMKLNAARFRYLNEQLYTSSSREAVDMFKDDPEAFTVYHTGFQSQVASWPVNPVDQLIKYIKSRASSLIVADFGCGDAKIAQSVPNKVHSFDLVAVNKHVTVCDISKVPLNKESVDIVTICLALMGNNWRDFLREAARVLKPKGVLKIIEVASRFEDPMDFMKLVEALGFSCQHMDDSNKMFVSFEFSKTKQISSAKLPDVKLLPCIYKRR